MKALDKVINCKQSDARKYLRGELEKLPDSEQKAKMFNLTKEVEFCWTLRQVVYKFIQTNQP